MKKILFSFVLSSLFVASGAFGMCVSCQPNYRHRTFVQAPAPVAQPEPEVSIDAIIRSGLSRVTIVTSAEHFRSLVSEGNVIVQFGATWCTPCKQLIKVLNTIAASYNDVKIIYVDTDALPALAQEFAIAHVPTLYFFRNGAVATSPVTGMQSEGAMREMIKNNFNI